MAWCPCCVRSTYGDRAGPQQCVPDRDEESCRASMASTLRRMGVRHYRTQTPIAQKLLFLDIVLSPLQKALDVFVFCLGTHGADEALPEEKVEDKHDNDDPPK